MSISTILIPLDGTELSNSVLNPVTRLLSRSGGSVTFLRAVGEGNHNAWPPLRAARARLLAMVPEAVASEIKSDLRVEKGKPAEIVLETVRRSQPDLVAMATHARTGLSRLVQGSVTEAVLRSCSVPTLLCNEHGSRAASAGSPFLRILVPLDGSELAQRIFPSVVDVAQSFGSEVILQRIVDGVLHEESPEYEHVVRYLDHYAARFRDAGLEKVRLHIASGDPAKTILETVDEERVGLVAMATHGRSGFDRLRVGSVAEEVLRRCPCPLLVVGGGEPTPEPQSEPEPS